MNLKLIIKLSGFQIEKIILAKNWKKSPFFDIDFQKFENFPENQTKNYKIQQNFQEFG